MGTVASACVLLLVLTTLIHYEALRGLSQALPLLPMPPRAKLTVLIIGAFAAHAVEITLYALSMLGLISWLGAGAFDAVHVPSFSMLMYFSAETYTSLGYGDIVPHGSLRLLAGAEALTGLLMIGWSASYVFVAMERFWDRR
ncbi:MAG: ion transporter [Ramlibacter sp.]|nr:ion transporter [Ramlibacter sp.]